MIPLKDFKVLMTAMMETVDFLNKYCDEYRRTARYNRLNMNGDTSVTISRSCEDIFSVTINNSIIYNINRKNMDVDIKILYERIKYEKKPS